MRNAVLAATIMLLAGCATQQDWVHPSTGQTNLASDRYRCEQDAARMYPPTFGQMPPQSTRPTTSTTNCQVFNGQVQCKTIQNPQAKTLAETLAEINSQQDQNAGRRASAINSCLASMGYQYTTIGGQSGYGNQAFIDSWERQQAVKRAARTLVSEKQTDRERTCYYNINGNQVVRTVPISRDCPWQPEGEIKENYVSQNGIKQESTTGGLQDYHKILVKGVQNTSGLWDCYYGRNLVLTSQNECPQRLP